MAKISNVYELPNKALYQNYFAKNEFIKDYLKKHCLYKTWWTGNGGPKYSDSSCLFVNTKDKTKEELREETIKTLCDIFDLAPEPFKHKFKSATKNNLLELRRISTLHSSSLIALLCFYNLEKVPLPYTMPDGTSCIFTNSYFECQNKIKNAPSPSNVDVVLTGKIKGTNQNVVLFLESKFSEYLEGNKKDDISDSVYGQIYQKLENQLKEVGVSFNKNKEGTKWSIQSDSNDSYYCEGVKQMISHYLGITYGIDELGCFGKEKSYCHLFSKDYDKIYLGEILFDFEDTSIDNGKLKKYKEIYKILASKLNAMRDDKFTVLSDILTYQEVFNGKELCLDENVKKFYRFK